MIWMPPSSQVQYPSHQLLAIRNSKSYGCITDITHLLLSVGILLARSEFQEEHRPNNILRSMREFKTVKGFLRLTFPIAGSSLFAIAPCQAGTFAYSQGLLEFKNFSLTPINIITDADTNTETITPDGFAKAIANAQSSFTAVDNRDTTANSSSDALATGDGDNYQGNTEGFTTKIGEFEVKAGQSLTFDFITDFYLQASRYIPFNPKGKASADGEIYFELVDASNNQKLDYFSLVGNLTNPNNKDFVNLDHSQNINFTTLFQQSDYDGLEKSAIAYTQGYYQRQFANKTNVKLLGYTFNGARVKVPEASASLSLIFFAALMMMSVKQKNKLETRNFN
jgi:hypothetical protein